MGKIHPNRHQTFLLGMNRINYIIPILILIVFLGYVWEFFPTNETWGFPHSPLLSDGSEIRISKQWYIAVLADKVRYVILAWALWFFAVPSTPKVLKFGAAIFCVKLTFVPINWMLFYMAPFKEERYFIMICLSILIGLFLTYLNGVIMRRRGGPGSNYS